MTTLIVFLSGNNPDVVVPCMIFYSPAVCSIIGFGGCNHVGIGGRMYNNDLPVV